MASCSKFRPGFGRTATDDAIKLASVNVKEQIDNEAVSNRIAENDVYNGLDDLAKPRAPAEDLQRGVQDVESVTRTWSKKTLIAVFLKYVLLHKLVVSNSVDLDQKHLASVLRQRFPIIDPVQPPTVRDQ